MSNGNGDNYNLTKKGYTFWGIHMRASCCQPELFMRKWQTNKYTDDTTIPLILRKIS